MARFAFAFDNNLMRAPGIFWQYLFVAVVTKLCFICVQQIFVRRSMGNMTANAFPFLQ
jgi:hypothetical protein